MSGCSARIARLVDRAFVAELPSRSRRRLREHLATCEPCRTRWQRLAAIDRVLGGPRLGDAATRDIESRIGASRIANRSWWIAAGALGALTTIVLVLVVASSRPREELSTRGGSGSGRTPGVRLFCIAGDGAHVRAETRMVSRGQPAELACTIEDDLQIAYTTPDREGLTMVAFARSGTTMIPYAPAELDKRSLPARADRVDELVDHSTHLGAEHRPGRYQVVVRFFDREVAMRDAMAGLIAPAVELQAELVIGGTDAR
jgi:hypothetical protein